MVSGDLTSLSFRRSYTQGNLTENPIEEFLKPCLEHATEFNMITGYFSSKLFQRIFFGLEPFLKNGGRIRILTGWLYDQDLNICLKDKKSLRKLFIDKYEKIIEEFEELNYKDHLAILSWLILNERLEIRFGTPLDEKGRSLIIRNFAILHEKIGYFKDKNDNIVSFCGSANATVSAWFYNREEFKVFNNWQVETEEYCDVDVQKFEKYWKKRDPGLFITDIPSLPKKILKKLRKYNRKLEELNFPNEIEFTNENLSSIPVQSNINNLHIVADHEEWKYNKGALIPIIATYRLRNCQVNALNYLENKKEQYCGILSMATGSGKTIAALRAIYNLSLEEKPLLVIVSIPDKFLVTQWYNELKKLFERDLIVQVHSDFPKGRKNALILARTIATSVNNLGIVLGTNRSLDQDFYKDIENQGVSKERILFIADECHSLGAPKTSTNLDFFSPKYRIGLSATPEREFDGEGTDFIHGFFKDIDYFVYGLNEGQNDNILMKFKYQFFHVDISDQDIEKYKKYSRYALWSKEDSEQDREKANANLIARARVLKKNVHKIKITRTLLENLNESDSLKKTVIYAFDKDSGPDSQINLLLNEVIQPLRNKFERYTVMLFDGSKNQEEREEIIDRFNQNDDLILIAMKCLDQGVDIPSLEKAIFLSSSGTTREHIQRAGRLLRKNPVKSKRCKYVETYDILSLPSKEQYAENPSICDSIIRYETERAEFFGKYAENSTELSRKLENIIREIKDVRITL